MYLFAALFVFLLASPAKAQEVGPTGSFQTSYPIEVPAYHGLEPDLGLTYNSNADNGLVGVGWELSGFSYIQRASPGKGTPNYDEKDVFFLDGMELIPCKAATPTEPATQSPSCQHPASPKDPNWPPYQAYTTKAESFRRIAFDPTYGVGGVWYVWDKDGTKTTYEPYSLFLDSSGGDKEWQVFSWSVQTIQEPADDKPNSWRNTVEYHYGHASNEKFGVQEKYPMFIEYVGADTFIRFSYEERPDIITSATGLSEFSTVRYRLKTIDVTVGSQRARAYELRYTNRDSSTGRSMLTEVQEYGRDTEICYTDTRGCDPRDPWWKATFTKRGETLPPVKFSPPESGEAEVGKWKNRYASTDRWSSDSSGTPVNKPKTMFLGDCLRYSDREPDYCVEHHYPRPSNTENHWMAGDLNGDGSQDLITIRINVRKNCPIGPCRDYSIDDVNVGTAISLGDGTYAQRRTGPSGGWQFDTRFFGSKEPPSFIAVWFPGDFNGDGKTDIIGATSANGKVVLLVAISNGDGTFRFVHQKTDISWQKAILDEKSDLEKFLDSATITLTAGLKTAKGGFVGLTHSFNGSILYQGAGASKVSIPQRWFSGDVNGDGKTDLTLSNPSSTEPSATISLCNFVSTGNLSTDKPLFVEQPCHPTGWELGDSHVLADRYLNGDFDGNGTSDIVKITKDHVGNVHFKVGLSGVGGRSFESYDFNVSADSRFGALGDANVWFPGDPNGDGKMDIMRAQETWDTEDTPYRHAALSTYSFDFHENRVRHTRIQETELPWHRTNRCTDELLNGRLEPNLWFPADVNGDGRTDFVSAYNDHSYNCLSPPAKAYMLSIAVGLTNPDGNSYEIRTSLTDQSWSRAFISPDQDDEFAFVPADTNGDGNDDMVYARGDRPSNDKPLGDAWRATTFRAPNTRSDAFRWQTAEINGDGRADLVYVEHLNPGVRVYTLPRGPDAAPRTGSDGRVDPIPMTISFSEVGPELDNVDNSHWLPADVNADGKTDLIYVDYRANRRCTEQANSDEVITKHCVPGDISESGLRVYTLMSNGDGSWEPRYDFLQGLGSEDVGRWMTADVNGDGKADLVYTNLYSERGPRPGARRTGVRVNTLLSNGDGKWTKLSQDAWPDFPFRDLANWRPMDINGDGRTDLVHTYDRAPGSPRASTCVHTLLSDGKGGWIRKPEPERFGSAGACLDLDIPDTLNWRTADVNGDGKVDLVHVGRGSNEYVVDTLLSSGSGDHWRHLSGKAGDGFWRDSPTWVPADVNSDGKIDLVHAQTRGPFGIVPTYFHQTNTLVSTIDGQWKATEPSFGLASRSIGSTTWQSADADGDGMDDLVRVDYLKDTGGSMGTLSITSHFSQAPLDLTTDFSNGLGGTTTVSYAPSSRWQPWSDPAASKCHLPVGSVLHHVSSVTTQEAVSRTSDAVSYDYGCPRWSYAERSFLGWELTGSTYPETQNSPQRLSLTRYKISDACGARIGVSEERAANNNILSRTETYYRGDPGWDYQNPGSPPYHCLQESNVEYQCGRGWHVVDDHGCAASRTEFSYDDEFGNIIETRECSHEGFDYNYNTIAPDCEKTSPNDQERTTLTEYKPATSSDTYIVGLPSREAVFEGLGHEGKRPVSDTRYCYDGDESDTCEAPPSRGFLTATKEWDDQDQRYLTTTYEYDTFGNQVKVIDAKGNPPTTTEFDKTYHLFPEKTCNALDQCTEQVWDPVIQQVVQSIDANGYSTHFNYDELGRPTQTCYPDGGVRQLAYLNWGDPLRQRVREFAVEDRVPWCEEAADNGVNWQEVDESSVRGIWTETRLDGLGRTRAVFNEGDAPGVIFEQDTLYADTSSRVYKQSHWYESGKVDPIHDRFYYDELGRLTSQSHPDGHRLRWEYGEDGTRISVTSIDEQENSNTVYNDAFGRTVQVRDENITVPNEGESAHVDYDTFYQYDVLDNPTKVTDDQGNVTTMTWDSLGRQLSLDDPDLGHWTYDEYDDVGNLLLQTDARGIETRFTYDELNRPETKQWNPPHGQITRWDYDEKEGHGKVPVGRLTSVSDPTGASCANGLSERLSYDEMGRVSSETKCVLGREYTTGTGYDLLGRQSWVEYPDGEKVDYNYDSAGRLQSMGSTQSYVDSLRYDAAGNLTYAKLPNGLEEYFHYDFYREWLTEASVQPADESPHQQRCDDETPPQQQGELYQACYEYKRNGLVESTSSTTNEMNLSFTYDDLNRLTDVTGDMEQHLDYGSIGNMTHNSTLGDYEYRPSGSDGCGAGETNAGPHAVCRAGSREYEYDANGNMTLRDGMEIRWNEENQPGWVEYKNGKWEHYLYDASGERVFKDDKDKPDMGKQELARRQARSHEYQDEEQGTRHIVVRPGDSLWMISSEWFGPDATPQQIYTAVEQIYALNQGEIGPDPDLIFAGQKFLVPPTWVPEQVQYKKGKREQRIDEASGERVLKQPAANQAKDKQKGGKGTYYFGPLLSYSSTSKDLTKYYYAGSMLVARKNSDGTHWFHSDHLGSTRLVTNEDGEVDQRDDYEPFGLGSSQLAGKKFENDIGFGGHRADANTGLSYMGARYYDPQLARFISPDSVIPDQFNPQALNRYSYVYNNPISYTDPTGHSPQMSPLYSQTSPEARPDPVTGVPEGPSPQEVADAPSVVSSPKEIAVGDTTYEGHNYEDWELDPESGKWRKVFGTVVRAPAPEPDWSTVPTTIGRYYMSDIHISTRPELRAADPYDPIKAAADRQRWDALRQISQRYPGASPAAAMFLHEVNSGYNQATAAMQLVSSMGTGQRVNVAILVDNSRTGSSSGAANVNAQAALRSKLSALQGAQTTADTTRVLPDGRIRYYGQEVPARNPGPTRGARFVTEWNPKTGSVRQWMESYNAAGQVTRVHPKMINGQTLIAPHYPPTGSELGK